MFRKVLLSETNFSFAVRITTEGNKFEFNLCDWLPRSAAVGENEHVFEIDLALSESQKFALCKDLDTSLVPSNQAAKKAKGLEELSQKYNFCPSYLKRQKCASLCERLSEGFCHSLQSRNDQVKVNL